MLNDFQLSENWLYLLFISFAVVTITSSVIASTWKQYYRNVPIGRLSHSQLRVKQGNATPDHRINVFTHSLILCLFKFRIYLISVLLWGGLLLLNHFQVVQL